MAAFRAKLVDWHTNAAGYYDTYGHTIEERAHTMKKWAIPATTEPNGMYHIQSQRLDDGTTYQVHIGDEATTCTCPDHLKRHRVCKHILYAQSLRT